MNPALIAVILEATIKYGPGFVQSIVEIFHTENPSLDQWRAAFAKADKSYDDYVKPAQPTN